MEQSVKQILVNNIQQWITIDNQIIKMSKKIKEINDEIKPIKDNRDILTNKITTFMREKNIEDNIITTSDGSIKFHESIVHAPITLKHLKICLLQYFDTEQDAEKLFDFIKNNRSHKTVCELNRKIN